jgi:hypothetical protein
LEEIDLRPWVTRSVLGMTEAHEEIGALCVRSVQRPGGLQRDLIMLRRLCGSKVIECVIAGRD